MMNRLIPVFAGMMVVAFLKSKEFTSLVWSIVDEQDAVLYDEITTCRGVIYILTNTNIDRIKLLANTR